MRGSPLRGNRSVSWVVLVMFMTIGGLETQVNGQERGRLSLNPYAALRENGASLISSGFDAPLRLPANQTRPSFAFGFTLPNDYQPNTVLRLVILWESPATQCAFALVPNFLFRARAGQPTGLGEASIGLQAVKASTPFTVTEDFITMAAPETAHQAASVRFTITPTPDVFPTQQQGDAVNFGIFRGDSATYGDTCDAELGIAGISIVYTKKTPGAHEMSEDSSED